MALSNLRSGTPITPKGTEVRTVIKHVTKRLKRHWPKTRIVWRGDSHYGRVEAMDWADDHGTDYIFGLPGNAVLDALVAEIADNLRFHHAMSRKAKLRFWPPTCHRLTGVRVSKRYGILGPEYLDHSALAPESFTTFAHLWVSSA